MGAPWNQAKAPQRPLPDDALLIVARSAERWVRQRHEQATP